MKVPPKRKGNQSLHGLQYLRLRLNESPSEKEGKCQWSSIDGRMIYAPQ